MSFFAERFFGVADITGAFVAGVILSNTVHNHFIARKIDITSYMFLAPVFFASVGLAVNLKDLTPAIIWFAVILTAVAILTKLIGCGDGALMCKYSKRDSLRVGVGMDSRGEVAIIVANKGAAANLMKATLFAPIILMVIVTTIVTPILLKFVFRGKDETQCVEKSPPIKKGSTAKKRISHKKHETT